MVTSLCNIHILNVFSLNNKKAAVFRHYLAKNTLLSKFTILVLSCYVRFRKKIHFFMHIYTRSKNLSHYNYRVRSSHKITSQWFVISAVEEAQFDKNHYRGLTSFDPLLTRFNPPRNFGKIYFTSLNPLHIY